jgi:hypothetical protein
MCFFLQQNIRRRKKINLQSIARRGFSQDDVNACNVRRRLMQDPTLEDIDGIEGRSFDSRIRFNLVIRK